jgi:Cytochrome C oxidase, cbb3-type, subunit III
MNKIIIAFTLLVLASCLQEKNGTDPTPTPSNSKAIPVVNTTVTPCAILPSANDKSEICYNTAIQPLLTASCATVGCHDSKTRADNYDFSSYAKFVSKSIIAGNPEKSTLYNVLITSGKRMPLSPRAPLTKEQQKLIYDWIKQGAKETQCNSTALAANEAVSYSKHIAPWLKTNCIVCHDGGSAGSGINLSTYDFAKFYGTNGQLLGTITHTKGYVSMPPLETKLPDCQIHLVKKWIDEGMKNN